MALKVPVSWLAEYVSNLPPTKVLAEKLTSAGLEVEQIEELGSEWAPDKLVVGEITAVSQHPNADRLCVVEVNYGQSEPVTVVTGADNIIQYVNKELPNQLKAPLALVGAVLRSGKNRDEFIKLKPGKLRGVTSAGMLCSELELGCGEDHEGIMIIPKDAPVGASLKDYLGQEILMFDIKGGFSHLLSVRGIARETAVLIGEPPLTTKVLPQQGQPNTEYVQINLPQPELCSRFSAVFVEGVSIKPSPKWLQQRLELAGIRPINAVVDASNYVMLEMGQPTHTYDYDRLQQRSQNSIPQINVRMAADGDTFTTLDGEERPLSSKIPVIADEQGIIGIAGIMGGESSEIRPESCNILIEAANFDYITIRQAAQSLKLFTEASERFGKNLSPAYTVEAALRVAELIVSSCGGTINQQLADCYPQPYHSPTIEIAIADVERILGTSLGEDFIYETLTKLDFTVKRGEPWQISPPAYRMDVNHPVDITEELGRIYGYNRLQPTLIRGNDQVQIMPHHENILVQRIKPLLVGMGMDEVITYSLVSRDAELNIYPEDKPNSSISLINPLSQNKRHLRRFLLPELLHTAKSNLRFRAGVSIFEIGAVFIDQGQQLPYEQQMLCGLIYGSQSSHRDWSGSANNFDFFDCKGIVEQLLERLKIYSVSYVRGADGADHPHKSAYIMLNDQRLGKVATLHPRLTNELELDGEAFYFELDIATLSKAYQPVVNVRPIPSTPPILEDIAFLVPQSTPAEDVRQGIYKAGGNYVTNVELFDLYENFEDGRKSLAFALTLQKSDQTLSNKEATKIRSRIANKIEQQFEAQLRGQLT